MKRVKIIVEEIPAPRGCRDCEFCEDGCGLSDDALHNLRCCGIDCGGDTALRLVGVEGIPEEEQP